VANSQKENGWISLHRKIKESPIFMKPPEWLKVWIYLLLEVDHQTGEGFFTWEIIQNGCHTTRDQLAECLAFMEEENMIIRKKLPRGVKITVQNWLDYQNKRKPTSTPTSKPTSTPTSEIEQEVSNEAEKKDIENFKAPTKPTSESDTGPTPISTISNNKLNNKEKEADEKKSANQPYQIFEYFYSKIAARDKEPIPETMINKDRELKNAKLLLKKMLLEECKQFLGKIFACNGFYCSKVNTLSYLYSNLTNIYQEVKKGGKDGKYIPINSGERKGGEADAGKW
jgi:hypothetical protein